MDTGLNLLSQLDQEDATARVLEELVGVGVANPVRCTEPRYSYSLSCSIFLGPVDVTALSY